MQTIVQGNQIVRTVIGKQRIRDTEYRLMKFLLEIEVEDGLLLQNVITGELALLTEAERKTLCHLPVQYEDGLEALVSGYYLVPVDFDELRFVQGYRKILQQLERNKKLPITKYTIFPTTCCNAHCFYCFESDYQKISMDSATARKVADFIQQNSEGQQIHISWFGGEPTVAENRIDEICRLLTERKVDYVSSMVSNGYLFTKEMVSKAVSEWHLQNIQITLDGTEEIYNKTKQYHTKENAYQRVLNNIRLILEAGIRVSVLLNLDYHNSDDLFALVDEVAERFRNYPNLRIASHVLFNDEGYEKVHHTEEDAEELTKRNHLIADYVKNAGLKGGVLGIAERGGTLPKLRYLYCRVNDSGAVVIGPNGCLYKCEHIDHRLTSPASLDHPMFDEQEMEKWFQPAEGKQCKSCRLYPECFVPAGCLNHAKCYPVDAERRIEAFKTIAETAYHSKIVGKGMS